MQVWLLDYEDSYVYNIQADFFKYAGVMPIIIPLDKHLSFFKKLAVSPRQKNEVIILGPGPGAPKDYKNENQYIKKLIGTGRTLIGICLGHQILATELGCQIVKSKSPKHGISEILKLNEYWKKFFKTKNKTLEVQRYNSLAVKFPVKFKLSSVQYLASKENEIMLLKHSNIFSMQFHPESVGTKYPSVLFKSIKSFIKDRDKD